jgi:hypothetical protein
MQVVRSDISDGVPPSMSKNQPFLQNKYCTIWTEIILVHIINEFGKHNCLLGFKSSFGGYSKMMFFLEKIRGEETG